MELDRRGAHRARRFDLSGVGIDEEGDHDPRLTEAVAALGECRLLARHVEPALGGELGAPFRHEAGGMRAEAAGDRHHLGGGGHFHVERRGERAEPFHVLVTDVAAVLAEMGGDAIRPGGEHAARRLHRVGMSPAAGIAQGGDVIDVDAKPDRAHAGLLLNLLVNRLM